MIPGYRLTFKGSVSGNYLTIEKADGYNVPAGVFQIKKSDESALYGYSAVIPTVKSDQSRLKLKSPFMHFPSVSTMIYTVPDSTYPPCASSSSPGPIEKSSDLIPL